jgi:hypothetical protein
MKSAVDVLDRKVGGVVVNFVRGVVCSASTTEEERVVRVE